ncbi:calpain-13-like isoform X2 [Rhinatrema bivittatum]|uniref:calpain-13-like isoform X2 n=1 Tax=Rhinatrema bivittatum TaxID=194408 RepID=UPI0011271948|nr:calpain-13-like isoform X2 [Rhinatrema bivittatum]
MQGPRGPPETHGGQQAEDGIGSLQNPRKFKNQDFHSLREFHLSRGLLFTDDEFPADNRVIGPELESKFNIRHLEWLRPKELHGRPQLIVEDVSLFDIRQNKILGDCWVLAALGSLTSKERFLSKVLPVDQEFGNKYAGIFHFRFWYFGEWVDVVIDDRLPALNRKLLAVHPSIQNEFWPCLLEKAYAKLHGSYQRLHWGNLAEAYESFSGGVAITFDLTHARIRPAELWEIVHVAKLSALIGCAVGQQMYVNNKLKNGLVSGHAYTVTDTAKVHYMNRSELLIRVWNPWGCGEWKGAWSDSSEEWNYIDPNVKKELHQLNNNGEFWMSWQDFIREFSSIVICDRSPKFLDVENRQSDWWKSSCFNRWVEGTTAGGRFFFNKNTSCRNPPYLMEVTESGGREKGDNVVVALMQNPANRQRSSDDWSTIGFKIYKVEPQFQGLENALPPTFFSQCEPRAIKTPLCNQFEVIQRFHLPAGTYVIVPSTNNKGRESNFLLRVYFKDCTKELRTKLSPNLPVEGGRMSEHSSFENKFGQYASQGQRLDACQLQKLLNGVFLKDCPGWLRGGGGFTEDECRGILALMDVSFLLRDIFQQADVNQLGVLEFGGLRNAIQAADLDVSNDMLNVMVLRYGDSSRRLNFTDFLCCMIRLKIMTRKFQFLQDKNGLYLTQEQWLQHIMYS